MATAMTASNQRKAQAFAIYHFISVGIAACCNFTGASFPHVRCKRTLQS